ncbi:NEQ412 [Nanoarchaeum equitans Kin4-M]|uniref:NEQ412 n=1 Tax=Nanoarchaeum equitans (strain Kin4-M) TaxID=228908 RepID=Q74ME1_NANEQ|nr:NEQ412 [Nanoarchaeum equitans Kin4-M]
MPTKFYLTDHADGGVIVKFFKDRESVKSYANVDEDFFKRDNAIFVKKDRDYLIVYVKDEWKAYFLAGRYIKNSPFKEFIIDLREIESKDKAIIGILSTSYIFDRYKSEKQEKIIKFICDDKEKVKEYITLMEAQYLARDLANEPPNVLNPETYEKKIIEIFKGLPVNIKVLHYDDLIREGLNLLVYVGKGSIYKPRLVILEYNLKDNPIVLVGKAITFDTGGYSLKPTDYMYNMHGDMSGSAAVIGALYAIAKNKKDIPIVALIPIAENVISGESYKVNDIIKAYNGKTVEVTNTDAEGRLTLADAIAYSAKYNPKAIIEVSTLTGGQIIALGHEIAAAMGEKDLVNKAIEAGKEVYELVWELPLYEGYRELLKSAVADIKNANGREAHAIQGGLFLKEFSPIEKFLHLDIAGPAIANRAIPSAYKGLTGFGVRLLYKLVQKL